MGAADVWLASFIIITFCQVGSLASVRYYAESWSSWSIDVRGERLGFIFLEGAMGASCFVDSSRAFLHLTKQTTNDSYYLLDSTQDLPAANRVPKFYHDEEHHNSIPSSSYFAWSGYTGVHVEQSDSWYKMPNADEEAGTECNLRHLRL